MRGLFRKISTLGKPTLKLMLDIKSYNKFNILRSCAIKDNVKKYSSNSAWGFLMEILADVGSLVLGGPAVIPSLLVGAFPIIRGNSKISDPFSAVAFHPTTIVRAKQLLRLWKTIVGEDQFVKEFSQSLSIYSDSIIDDELPDGEKTVIGQFNQWTESNYSIVLDLFNYLIDCLPGSICSDIKNGKIDTWSKERVLEITKNLHAGRFADVTITAKEIPNLIWYKRVMHQDIPRHRAPWRKIALYGAS